MKLLSFIVPMYNVSKYLEDCLNSLVCQDMSHDEYEIILIDDGSTDNTAQIAEEYCNKYSNITLIKKENGGVSEARNVGIENASGKYIWFIDSDDFIAPSCLKSICKILLDYEPHFVSMSYIKVTENCHFQESDGYELRFVPINQKLTSSTVCMTILRRDTIIENNIRFNKELKYGEDTLFQYYYYILSNNQVSIYIKNNLYAYRQRANSSLNSKKKSDFARRTQDFIKMAKIYKSDFDNKIVSDDEMLKYIKRAQYLSIEGALTELPRSDLSYKQIMKDLKSSALYPYPKIKNQKDVKGFKNKIKRFIISSFRFGAFYRIYYIFARLFLK